MQLYNYIAQCVRYFDFWTDDEEDEETEILVNVNVLENKKLLILNLPPYVTEKDIKDALPASDKIVRIDIHGDTMNNTIKTIQMTTKSHFNKNKMMEAREQNMEVTNR